MRRGGKLPVGVLVVAMAAVLGFVSFDAATAFDPTSPAAIAALDKLDGKILLEADPALSDKELAGEEAKLEALARQESGIADPHERAAYRGWLDFARHRIDDSRMERKGPYQMVAGVSSPGADSRR